MIDFKLDPKSGVPFYRQIIDQIRYGVATGSLNVGEQLPTVRSLAVGSCSPMLKFPVATP